MACYCPAFCFKASENKESSLVFVLGKQFMACLPGAPRSDEHTWNKGLGDGGREKLESGASVSFQEESLKAFSVCLSDVVVSVMAGSDMCLPLGHCDPLVSCLNR